MSYSTGEQRARKNVFRRLNIIFFSDFHDMKNYPVRFKPHSDLYEELVRIVNEKQWPSGWVVTGIGSLSRVALRFANKEEPSVYEGSWEICSLAGTLSTDGIHIHMVVSDEKGTTLGGHLVVGNIIRTTAELVLGYSVRTLFHRVGDDETKYPELVVQEREE